MHGCPLADPDSASVVTSPSHSESKLISLLQTFLSNKLIKNTASFLFEIYQERQKCACSAVRKKSRNAAPSKRPVLNNPCQRSLHDTAPHPSTPPRPPQPSTPPHPLPTPLLPPIRLRAAPTAASTAPHTGPGGCRAPVPPAQAAGAGTQAAVAGSRGMRAAAARTAPAPARRTAPNPVRAQ